MTNTVSFTPQPVQMRFIEAKQDVVFFGGGAGGGKSYALLLKILQGIHDPDFVAMVFRNTFGEINKGLWPLAKKLYTPLLVYPSGPKKGKFIGKAHISEKLFRITFPQGSFVEFGYMGKNQDGDAEKLQGLELAYACLDESTHFTSYQFEYMRSRNRTTSTIPEQTLCTLNPDPNSFVYDYIKDYLDDEGYPVPDLCGKSRYFTYVEGELVTSWDAKEIKEKYGKNPKTYTYILSTLDDNKYLSNTGYRDTLDAMPEKKRKQLLLGCWKTDTDNGIYWKSEWLQKASKLPAGCRTVRGYDLASTEYNPEEGRFPDYTASMKVSKCPDGYYYLTGDYIPEFGDEKTPVVGRMRKRSGDRDKIMLKQAQFDGDSVQLILPQDSGAAGKDAFVQKVQFFSENGFTVQKDNSVSNVSKLVKFEPFATACEHGLVYIVESTFNKATLDAFYNELQVFDNSRSTSRRKDDWVDATATAFNALNRVKVIPKFKLDLSGSHQTGFKKAKESTIFNSRF